MKISNEQIKEFKELGYLFIENAFDEEEVKTMTKELPDLYNMDRKEVQREKNGKAVRTIFAAHKFNTICEKISRHPEYCKSSKTIVRRGCLYPSI